MGHQTNRRSLMTEPLTPLQKELLLAFIKHHLQYDMRHKLMIELPDAYNRWMGNTIVVSQIDKHPDGMTRPLISSN